MTRLIKISIKKPLTLMSLMVCWMRPDGGWDWLLENLSKKTKLGLENRNKSS